jgi:hypothetical protein
MPPPQSSSAHASAAQASARSIAATLALARHTAEVRRLEVEHMAAKARRVRREDEIMKSIPSKSATFINVDYRFTMRELQTEAVRTRSHLSSMTNKTGREYAMYRQRLQRLSEDIEERHTSSPGYISARTLDGAGSIRKNTDWSARSSERGVKTLLRHCMSALAF